MMAPEFTDKGLGEGRRASVAGTGAVCRLDAAIQT
jgi:hypothetical protein